MSVSDVRLPAFGSAEPPARVWPRVLGGQVLAALAILALEIAASVAGVRVPSLYRPWPVADAWAALADAGWCLGVCVVLGRTITWELAEWAPARLWVGVAAGLGGYGAALLGHSTVARVLLAVVLTTQLVRWIAFTADGPPRPAPRLPWAGRALAALVALAVVPFGVLHPFAATGGGGSGDGSGRGALHDVALSASRLAVTVAGVSVADPRLRLADAAFALDDPAAPGRPAHGPFVVPAGRSLWIRLRVVPRDCARPSGLQTVRVHYRMLGISLSESVRLGSASVPRVACR